jgi:hypothetical protein
MVTADTVNPLEERHYTISELAEKWNLSAEFVRQILRGEPGVTEWVRQRPGRRRYRVIRVPQSVAERLYRRAQSRADVGETLIQGQDDTQRPRERQRRGRF